MTGIAVVTMTYIEWDTTHTNPVAMDQNPLTAEEQQQHIIPIFTPSGHPLSAEQSAEILQSVTSEQPLVYDTQNITSVLGYQYWTGTVAHGATSQPGSGVVMLNTNVHSDISSGWTCEVAQAYTNISLPDLEQLEIQVNNNPNT
jgi:hypothetical protein